MSTERPDKRVALHPRSPGEARPARARLLALGRRGFPFSPPTWPAGVPLPSPRHRLGTEYDTSWARRYPARLARVLITELLTRPAVRVVADPEVGGLDRIEHLRGPVVFAANHASHVDTPLLLSVIPERWRHRTVVAAGADYFFDNRVKSALFALSIAAVPIERQRVSRSSANRAAGLLAEGWSLLIFPEGGRTPDGWGQPHRAGAAWLAERAGTPLVPVHVEGTGAILPRGAKRPHPGRTRVTFGRPLYPAGDVRALAARLERAIAVLADERSGDWWAAQQRSAAGTTPSLTGPEVSGWRRSWAHGERHRAGGGQGRRWPR